MDDLNLILRNLLESKSKLEAPMSFKSKTSYRLTAGKVFVVENPHQCNDFNHLLNQKVMVDGEEFIINGVEARMHGAPWKQGEDIGLMGIRELDTEIKQLNGRKR